MDLQGTVALVTGGASGLGEATVRRLAAAGAQVVAVDLDSERGASVAEETGAVFVETDVTSEADVGNAVEVASGLGPLRTVVNVAGGGKPPRKLVSRKGVPHDLESWRFTLELNLTGVFNVVRLALPAMSALDEVEGGGRGVVVNTSAVGAPEGGPGLSAYCSAKAGLEGFCYTAARELGPLGIRVVTVIPGGFDTPALAALYEVNPALAEVPPPNMFPRRPGRPDEFAALVEHVVTNDFINATTIRIDGGFRLAVD